MKRVNIYITDNQYATFKQLAKETGLKFTEHVRRAMDKYIKDENVQIQTLQQQEK